MKNCPNCKLINPDDAIKCDCGYNFTDNKIYKTQEKQPVSNSEIGLTFMNTPAFKIIRVVLAIVTFYLGYIIVKGVKYEIVAGCTSDQRIASELETMLPDLRSKVLYKRIPGIDLIVSDVTVVGRSITFHYKFQYIKKEDIDLQVFQEEATKRLKYLYCFTDTYFRENNVLVMYEYKDTDGIIVF